MGKKRVWVFLFLFLAAPDLLHAATLTYAGPGGAAAPCDTTLQACINGASSGDTVAIATNSRIDENLTIGKSLTLTATSGFTPLIGSANTATPKTISIVDAGPAGGSVAITLDQLNLNAAMVDVTYNEATDHSFIMSNCNLTFSTGNNNDTGVGIGPSVPSTAVIRNSTLSTPGQTIEFDPNLASGSATLTVLSNRLTTPDPANSHEGIQLRPRGAGTVTVNLQNNVIHGVGGCNCGTNAGMDIETTGVASSVNATVNVINNTLDDIETTAPGIFVGTPTGTSQLTVNLFNNIITNVGGAGIDLPVLSARLTVNNNFNDFFATGANDFGGYTQGANTLNANPLYVDASSANYHLQASSSLVDAGTSTPTGGLPSTDFDGNPRTAGSAPDLGAFEVVPVCGDGVVNSASEQCDDGNSVDTDACRNTCVAAACGDGVTDTGEGCDDGNAVNTDACLNTCASSTCGDGAVQSGVEQCDNGSSNSDTTSDACRTNCTSPRCGDNVADAGEACDDGNTTAGDGCAADCSKVEVCGDGTVDSGEACDDGNTVSGDGCRVDCSKTEVCGDGTVDTGEACDDGNTDDGDDCPAACVSLTCGNGTRDNALEECDDGNVDNTDACLEGCIAAECGDGIVRTGVEDCDDGNTDEGDSCPADCRTQPTGGGGGCNLIY